MRIKFRDYLKKYTWQLFLAAMLCVCACGLTVLGPQLLGDVTTQIFEGIMAKLNGTGAMDLEAITGLIRLLAVLYLFAAALMAAAGRLTAYISSDLAFRIRTDTVKKINTLPLPYFEKNSVGEILSRITTDTDTLEENAGRSALRLVTGTASVTGILIMMLRISFLLTAVLAGIILTAGGLIWFLSRRAKRYKRLWQKTAAETTGYVEEMFSGKDLLHAFGRENAVLTQYGEYNEQLKRLSVRAEGYSELMNAVMRSAAAAGYAAAVLLGGMIAFQNAFSVGNIQAFIHYIRNLDQPIRQISSSVGMMQSAAAAWQRIAAVLSEPEENGRAARKSEEISSQKGEICFSHVTFSYGDEPPVLSDFSARILPGQRVAVTGCTGIGKTTLIKLLMRFYDVSDGMICVDGRDVRTYDRTQLRSKFSMVLQETWLFCGTVLDNIRYGRPDATREEVKLAARAAAADDFIERLPMGYDTVISKESGMLSQGEKQQLTIARAILAEREILIFDEATSSVDTLTEQRIREGLETAMQGKTCFIIAHRPQTIQGADLVLSIEGS